MSHRMLLAPNPSAAVCCRTRSLRSDYELTRQRPPLFLACKDAVRAELLRSAGMELTTLTSSESATVLEVCLCVGGWGGGGTQVGCCFGQELPGGLTCCCAGLV